MNQRITSMLNGSYECFFIACCTTFPFLKLHSWLHQSAGFRHARASQSQYHLQLNIIGSILLLADCVPYNHLIHERYMDVMLDLFGGQRVGRRRSGCRLSHAASRLLLPKCCICSWNLEGSVRAPVSALLLHLAHPDTGSFRAIMRSPEHCRPINKTLLPPHKVRSYIASPSHPALSESPPPPLVHPSDYWRDHQSHRPSSERSIPMIH